MTGTLYLIPNTLGPAAETDPLTAVLPTQVQSIAARLTYYVAENAKSARAFLKLVSQACPLATPLQEIRISELNVQTTADKLPALLAPLRAGMDAGLISDAGVPAVADPGANLVRLAHAEGIPVKPLVGPSSLLLALMASGLNGQSFAFHGYLPSDPTQRIKRLRQLEERSRNDRQTQLFIETPYRNLAMLESMAANCRPTTMLCVATDLTLPTESIITRRADAWLKEVKNGKLPDIQKKPTVFLLLAEG